MVCEVVLKVYEKLLVLKLKECKVVFDEMIGCFMLYLNFFRKKYIVWGIEIVYDGGVEMISIMLYIICEELFCGKNGVFIKLCMIVFFILINK